jgi:hypothetical protein
MRRELERLRTTGQAQRAVTIGGGAFEKPTEEFILTGGFLTKCRQKKHFPQHQQYLLTFFGEAFYAPPGPQVPLSYAQEP